MPRCSRPGVQRDAEDDARKQAALRYILDAWEEALHDGIEPEMLANAALVRGACRSRSASMARMPWPR